jgi:glycosyltransferase involved in cell wall biosynthesis
MKIIHVPFCFAPDPMGGTEVYVRNLVRDLEELGIDTMVAAPSEISRHYVIDGIRVRRYAVTNTVTDVAQLYGAGDPVAAAEFAKILDEELPDVVHLHAFTRGASLRLVQAAKQRGIRVVFTYHTPTVSCQRGTLMLRGVELCDGRLDVTRCASCTLDGLGIHGPLAGVIGRLPPSLGNWLGNHGLQGGIWTALRTSDLIRVRHDVVRRLMAEVDHIVAVCNWVQKVILLNDVSPSKVSLSRHGITWEPNDTTPLETSSETRIAFIGRFEPTKGLHVLINAFRMAPTMNARLDIYGITQSSANAAYEKKMRSLAGSDPRISFRGPIPLGEVVSQLRRYDFLAVPSQWLETGPLVVLEAFAAGIPIIGWDTGGVAELVRHDVDGLLIEPPSVSRWIDALQRVANDAGLRARLKAGVRPPRHSRDVASEMLALYDSLLTRKSTSQPESSFLTASV